ncbi:hypothetical protein [Microvirus D_HF38_35]|nr:hypothetical protein [Microvirus D_HF38_35]
MLKYKFVFCLLRKHELYALDKLLSYGRFGRNRSELLRAIIDVGVSNSYYADVALSQQMPTLRTDCVMSCRMDLELLSALSILARRREIPMSKFVRRMIMACYYCDEYQDAVCEVINGE